MSILASFAIAMRWRTAFVDPPRAMTTVIAFSKAFFVRISSGFISFWIRFIIALPAFSQSRAFSSETASCAELFAKLRPNASIADAIVFAVYIPPHAPGPGIAVFSTSSNSASSIFPLEIAPTASKTETISLFFGPGLIVPP